MRYIDSPLGMCILSFLKSHLSNNEIFVSFIYYLEDLKCSQNNYAVPTFTTYKECIHIISGHLIMRIIFNYNWSWRDNVVTVKTQMTLIAQLFTKYMHEHEIFVSWNYFIFYLYII